MLSCEVHFKTGTGNVEKTIIIQLRNGTHQDMGEDRYFANPFPEYSAQSARGILTPDSHRLDEEFVVHLRKSVMKLTNLLEEKLTSHLDWGDTSVYTGAAGYIYLYLHLHDVFRDDKYLNRALTLTEKCLSRLKGRRQSFLCGDAGPLALGAVVYDRLNQVSDVDFCVTNLKKLKTEVLDLNSDIPDEMLYGRAGYLYALLFVRQKVRSHTIDSELIRAVIASVIKSGQNLSRQEHHRSPLLYEWHEKKYLGAAHGMAGIFTLLLQVKDRLTVPELMELVRPSIDYLCTLVFPSGNFPSSLGSNTDRLVHWCHGAPGAVFLFGMAYKVFQDEKYLGLAKRAADVVWERGLLKKGYGLCHGPSGNGYALLYMYQMTNDPKYLYEAGQFARWCQDFGKHDMRVPDRPYSLFEGLAGPIYFLSDVLHPAEAKFPAFIL